MGPRIHRLTEFAKKRPSLVALLVGLVMAGLLVALVDLVCSLTIPKSSRYEGEFTQGFIVEDPVLGYRPRINSRVTARKRGPDGAILYDVVYATDEFGRRITPVDNPDSRDRFAVFFGCSLAFGEGLNNDETLPYYFARAARRYQPHNYAFCGYGPHNMLAYLQTGRFYREIPENTGLVICYGGWIERVTAKWLLYGGSRDFPYYRLDGELKTEGTFKAVNPITFLLYNHLRLNPVFKRLGLNSVFFGPDDRDVELTAAIIKESARLVHRFRPAATFVFVNPPGFGSEDYRKLTRDLMDNRITVLDYGSREDFRDPSYSIQGDGHPTAKFNREMARILLHDLGE